MKTQVAKVYRGSYAIPIDGAVAERRVTVNGKELPLAPSLKIWNHSPTGFAWGYAGSGPAQLALAILLDYYGDEDRASRLHQDFKFRVIARLPMKHAWEITGELIENQVAQIEEEEQS